MNKQEKNSFKEENKNINQHKKDIRFWIIYGILFTVVLVSQIIFGFKLVFVNGQSMMPTYKDKQICISTNFKYTPKQGDIIVAKNDFLNENIIKRVIATEGQTVEVNYSTNEVLVDGKAIQEDYINVQMVYNPEVHTAENPIVVPDGCIFVMGDNRNDSLDSRNADVGCVSYADIIGKVFN